MCKNTLVTLTPLNPVETTYDPENPNAPYALGYIDTFGGITSHMEPFRLWDQASLDKIDLAFNPVPLDDVTIDNIETDLIRRSVMRCIFNCYNVREDNQLLMIFSLETYIEGAFEIPTAQFFIGTELVRTEVISGQHQVALLMDALGESFSVPVYIRLAAEDSFTHFSFKGVSIFLL